MAELDFVTIGELRQLAEEKLSKEFWDYANGGSASETTLRRNRRALKQWAIEQHVLLDVRDIDLSVEFLGRTLPMPMIVAPMGSLYRFCHEGDIEMARGAGREGIVATVSGVCGWPMEQIAEAAAAPLIFQLYHHGDRDWVNARLDRVQSCPQYMAICLTVDNAIYSRRDRDVANRFVANSRANRGKLPEQPGPDHDFTRSLTWADVDWLRSIVKIPFGLKGIGSGDDAKRALDHGVDFIWVSNHGGRQLDDARATADTLQEVAETVSCRVPIVVDGGFQRGTDIIKGRALGATVVAMGKACSWGLTLGGANGIQGFLQILRHELTIAMGLSGNTSMRGLTRKAVRKIDY
ncbi:MAG TPA: alpha-hydroxy acid oxidase [Chloroflexota bacterium]|nr:alpha-hydroxy acid oxidase [Chloroflexota bacterium]